MFFLAGDHTYETYKTRITKRKSNYNLNKTYWHRKSLAKSVHKVSLSPICSAYYQFQYQFVVNNDERHFNMWSMSHTIHFTWHIDPSHTLSQYSNLYKASDKTLPAQCPLITCQNTKFQQIQKNDKVFPTHSQLPPNCSQMIFYFGRSHLNNIYMFPSFESFL